MDKSIILVMFVTIMLLFNKELKDLFIYYYLPVQILIPVYYQTKLVDGIPEMAFWSAVLLPIAFVWFFNQHCEGYRFSLLELFIILHLLCVFGGEWHNTTYKEAQKVFYNDLTIRMIPFLMARAWFSDPDSRLKMFRVIVIIGAIVALFQLWEAVTWNNVFDMYLRRWWPKSVPWGARMMRGGIKRAAGPFGHPICAGYFFAMFTPLAVWLWKNDYFKVKKHGLWATCLCVVGGLSSYSRAPIAGILIGFVVIWYGWQERKTVPTMVLASLLTVLAILVAPKIIEYINVDRSSAETEDQRNAAYRAELLENYDEVIAEKPLFGWGRFGVPVVKGQDSIDNEYLVIILQSGRVSYYAYLLCIVWVVIRLSFFVIFKDPLTLEARLGWGLLAGVVAAAFTQATVYSGTQTVQFFYILLGFAEGLMQLRTFEGSKQSVVPARILGGEEYGYHFHRTL